MHYRYVKCFDLKTNKLAGYLGMGSQNYVTLVSESDEKSWCKWERGSGGELYLARDTTPTDRWLGEGTRKYADWGLSSNYYSPVIVNDDGSLSLSGDSKRKLYGPYSYFGTPYCCWSDGDARDDILRIELTDPRRWLRSIPSATLICDINLPGTHNSGAIQSTRVAGGPWSCQDQSITQQLESGIRLLDLRLKVKPNVPIFFGSTTYDFALCHGNFMSGIYANEFGALSPALDECSAFLTKYPTEFIAIILKIDDWNGVKDTDKPTVVEALDKLLLGYPTFGSGQSAPVLGPRGRPIPLRATMPTLEEVRGSFYLLDRIGRPSGSTLDPLAFGPPLSFPNNTGGYTLPQIQGSREFTVVVQDKYENLTAPAEATKFTTFKNAIALKTPGVLLLNFASATKPDSVTKEHLLGVYIQDQVVKFLDTGTPPRSAGPCLTILRQNSVPARWGTPTLSR